MTDHSNTPPEVGIPLDGTPLCKWWLHPMTAERLHGIALILTTEENPGEPGPIGQAALAEFREWQDLDTAGYPGIEVGWGEVDEIDYRAICWYDENVS